ncbi:MAG: glycosyltransferase involved in cell wall biosynthesis [Candidatus Krumholzibacteriia bacterium]|jgi:glycosyltransferase involved in cell wall biosynthesis
MKLLYDLKSTQTAILGAGGGGEYSRAVFRRLVAMSAALAESNHEKRDESDTEPRLAAFYQGDHPLDPDIQELVLKHNIDLHPIDGTNGLQALLSSGKFSSFMSGLPYHTHTLNFGQMVVFLGVHGLRPLEQMMPFHGRHYARGIPAKAKWLAKYLLEQVRPQWRAKQFQALVNLSCRQLHVIVPSWHTRYSMVEKLDLPADLQIHDFYCPEAKAGTAAQNDVRLFEKLGVREGKYLFMVSGDRWIKNTWRALTALIEVMDKLPDDKWLPVVVTGGVPSGLPRGKRPYVISSAYLNRDELATMYRGARAFYYPTLNEGFGYPPFEAMAQGTPVVCSAISSITEVVGDAAIYFNPFSLDEMKIRLRLVVEDDDLLAEHVQRGERRLAVVRARQNADLDKLCQMLLDSVPKK